MIRRRGRKFFATLGHVWSALRGTRRPDPDDPIHMVLRRCVAVLEERRAA